MLGDIDALVQQRPEDLRELLVELQVAALDRGLGRVGRGEDHGH